MKIRWGLFHIGCILVAGFFVMPGKASALEYQVNGQLSGWAMESEENEARQSQWGLRYLPEITVEHAVSPDLAFDIEASLNGYVSHDTRDLAETSDLDLYRLKLRWTTAKTEFRLGLQKISFGPAFLLRPLQWFDRVDPRDPLHLTEGVYAALFKYTALNNANGWIWMLLCNDDPKGIDILPSDPDWPEAGGRVQYPVLNGEMAVSWHIREMDLSDFYLADEIQQRLGVDGRWDIGVGFWFEAVAQHQEIPFVDYQWLKLTTVGMDYTFSIGKGLHALGEHLIMSISEKLPEYGKNYHFSAFSLNYPVSLFDAVSYIGYYEWDQNTYAQYASWQRTYDKWVVSFSLFRYPETGQSVFSFQQQAAGAGSGAQAMVIFNH
jgi:hypothetical protein